MSPLSRKDLGPLELWSYVVEQLLSMLLLLSSSKSLDPYRRIHPAPPSFLRTDPAICPYIQLTHINSFFLPDEKITRLAYRHPDFLYW